VEPAPAPPPAAAPPPLYALDSLDEVPGELTAAAVGAIGGVAGMLAGAVPAGRGAVVVVGCRDDAIAAGGGVALVAALGTGAARVEEMHALRFSAADVTAVLELTAARAVGESGVLSGDGELYGYAARDVNAAVKAAVDAATTHVDGGGGGGGAAAQDAEDAALAAERVTIDARMTRARAAAAADAAPDSRWSVRVAIAALDAGAPRWRDGVTPARAA